MAEKEHRDGWPQPCPYCGRQQHTPKAMRLHSCKHRVPEAPGGVRITGNPNTPRT